MTPALEARVVQIRLAAGLVLFTYVASHLLEQTAGLFSLAALEEAHRIAVAVWRFPLFWVIAPAALLTHIVLALFSLLRRRTARRMTAAEIAQASLAHLIPVFLLGHLAQTRVMATVYGIDDTYALVLSGPFPPFFHVGLLAVAWGHGLLGVRAYLRNFQSYERTRSVVWGALLALPVLALAGVARAGAELHDLPMHGAVLTSAGPIPRDVYEGHVLRVHAVSAGIVLGAIALAWVGRAAWGRALRLRPRIEVRYPLGRVVNIPPGTTLLEASRLAGVDHVSVCGGRGRCTTCRVKVHDGAAALPAPSPAERRVLARIRAPQDVRIACQVRPVAPVAIAPILRSRNARPQDGSGRRSELEGREENVVILFADLRGFTRATEKMLPFDVAHLLNLYFDAMGTAIESHGGYVDKFVGDGVMALFGIGGERDAAKRALAAADEMGGRLDELGAFLQGQLERPLEMGIGIHRGPAIVAKMGFANRLHLTAVGDAVNTASRLEALTKELGCWLVVSEPVLTEAGIAVGGLQEVTVRGRIEPLRVAAIPRGDTIPGLRHRA